MTRRNIYCGALVVFLVTVGLTFAAISIPEWIVWDAKVPDPLKPIYYNWGLYSRCSPLTGECYKFPRYEDCQGNDRSFCSWWRTAGFLMAASVPLQLASFVAFLVPIVGGKQKRQCGWRIICGALILVVACQIAAMAIIVSLRDNDERFSFGWAMGRSFSLCIASWVILLVVDAALTTSAFVMEEEEGYELIPNQPF